MNLDFEKYADGLIPAIVQSPNGRVLMLGFMNEEALVTTRNSGRVTFYSRSKQRLWTKGETSGNFLDLMSISQDCDADTLLVIAKPHGPVCHTGKETCFGDTARHDHGFISELESVVADRRENRIEGSHISRLFTKGLNKIAQKVGEEAVELVIAAKDDDLAEFKGEAADLFFHYLILLQAKGVMLEDVLDVLKERRK